MRKRLALFIKVIVAIIVIFSATAPHASARPAAVQYIVSDYKPSEIIAGSQLKTEKVNASVIEKAHIVDVVGGLPLYFVENQGQSDEQVSFYIQGSDKNIYFSPQGVTFALTAPLPPSQPTEASGSSPLQERMLHRPERQRWAVKLDFVGSNPSTRPVGEHPTSTIVSFFKGPPDQWQTGVSTFSQIRYPNLWPGIDLVYSGLSHELKYEFVVQPGANPADIQLAYRGASAARMIDGGQMEISTPLGSFRDATPLAYQVIDGERVQVEMAFDLSLPEIGAGQANQRFGFKLGGYDPALPLILDPAVLIYAGFIGGESDDLGRGIAVDSTGNIYITGDTYSANFPVNSGPDTTFNEWRDAFVAKVNAAGTGLVYAGYIGGNHLETSTGIAVDDLGNAYITGLTASDQSSFPVIGGPDLSHNGDYDAFVTKINPSGTALVYSGFIGGEGLDSSDGIALDINGAVYITGWTGSNESSFPVKVGPDLTFNNAPGSAYRDAFVAMVNAAGSELVYAGYIGGILDELSYDIAVDIQGSAYIVGATNSNESSFPVVVGPDLTYNGLAPELYADAFVAKVNPAGTGLLYAGYIGGWMSDWGMAIIVDDAGNAYVTGETMSQGDFPVIGGPYLTSSYKSDAFVSKINPSGSALVFSGFIGGSADDAGFDIALDANGVVFITGATNSDQSTFPILDGTDDTYNGEFDAFITAIKPPAGSVWLVYSGYIGGAGDEFGTGIAVDSTGNAYITGFTQSTEASFPVKDGPDLTHNGLADVFVAKVAAWRLGQIDLEVNRIELIQGITMSPSYTVYVANKPALVRAFVTLEGVTSINGVTGRLTRYVNGVVQETMNAGPVSVFDQAHANEGDLIQTLNFNIPAASLVPGTSFVLEVDPGNAIPETNENNNRYPASGVKSFNFVNTPVLNVVIVPVTYARPGAPVTTPQINDLNALTSQLNQFFPVGKINYTVRNTPYTFTGDLRTSNGWSQLLDEIRTVHLSEDPQQNKIYYGLIDAIGTDGCSSCTGGIAYLNSPTTRLEKTAVGISSYPNDPDWVSRAMAHEIAHLYGRRHANCGLGIDFYMDFNYPYEYISIGQIGYNTTSGQLVLPSTTKDYMSYCKPAWTSDYTYYGIYQAFNWVEGWPVLPVNLPFQVYVPAVTKGGPASQPAATGSQTIILSGVIEPDGSLYVAPIFPGRILAPADGSNEGSYQVVLLDANDHQLAASALEITQVAFEQIESGQMGYGFIASLQKVAGLNTIQIYKDGNLIFERRGSSTAPILDKLVQSASAAGTTHLSWSPGNEADGLVYRILYSPDGGTTQQMLAANSTNPGLTIPEDLLKGALDPVLIVQVSDGIQTDERVYPIPVP